MTNTDSPLTAGPTGIVPDPTDRESYPADFTAAVESMHAASLRPELTMGVIRPPQRLAPYSHAIGLELNRGAFDKQSTPSEDSDAFARLIVLHDPHAEETWDGTMRLVAYIQADMDGALSNDPLLPEVAWQWLNEALENHQVDFSNLGGTVTSTSSQRFGEIGGPGHSFMLEMRASWTAESTNLTAHVEAFADVLASVIGLAPEGITSIARRTT